MVNSSFRILSTKELPAPLLEQAATQGVHITVQPFIRISSVANEDVKHLLQPATISVFTSAHAVQSIQPFAYPQHICCLSGATLKAVTAAFPAAIVIATGDNATELAKAITTQAISEVVFFCGNQRRDELPDYLRQHQVKVREVVVYETLPAPIMTPTQYDGILFFSPSGVNSFFSSNILPPATICFAIGNTTATALQKYTNNIVVNPGPPSAEQLVQTALNNLI